MAEEPKSQLLAETEQRRAKSRMFGDQTAPKRPHWLRFLKTFRSICIDPPAEIRVAFEMMRNL